MSQHPHHPQQPQPVYHQPKPTNGLGIAGFVCALVGLVAMCLPFGGLIGIVGLILSFIALFKKPRGFAIAGTILGLVPLLVYLSLFILFGGAMLFGFAAAATMLAAVQNATTVNQALDAHYQQNNAYPPALTALNINTTDASGNDWSSEFVYTIAPDAQSYILTHYGIDEQFDTSDDLTWSAANGAPATSDTN